MLIRKPADIPYSEVTPQGLYLRRREFIQGAAGAALTAAAALSPLGAARPSAQAQSRAKLPNVVKGSKFSTTEKMNSYQDVTNYNNFYEFGTGKGDPAEYAGKFVTRPWTIKVEGLVNKPETIDIDTFKIGRAHV